jgi:type II secretory pathway pseudopilin PulG
MLSQSRQSGLTLIELLTAATILTLILTAMVSLFAWSYRRQAEYQTHSQVQLQYRLAFEEMSRMIGQAIQLEEAYGSYRISLGDIILKLPSINGGSEIIANSYDYVIFRQATEVIAPAAGSARRAVNRRLIDSPVTVSRFFTLTDGGFYSSPSQAPQIERVRINFSKQQLINGKSTSFNETREFALRNH